MHFQYIPYAWILLASALATAAVGFYAWRQRRVPGAHSVVAISATTVVWSLSNALEMAGADLPTKLSGQRPICVLRRFAAGVLGLGAPVRRSGAVAHAPAAGLAGRRSYYHAGVGLDRSPPRPDTAGCLPGHRRPFSRDRQDVWALVLGFCDV